MAYFLREQQQNARRSASAPYNGLVSDVADKRSAKHDPRVWRRR